MTIGGTVATAVDSGVGDTSSFPQARKTIRDAMRRSPATERKVTLCIIIIRHEL